MQATVIIVPTVTAVLVRRRRNSRVFANARVTSSSDDVGFHLASLLQSDARAYGSVAEHERCVFVGDIRVTTFHTQSYKNRL
jgi:hypothetical protein